MFTSLLAIISPSEALPVFLSFFQPRTLPHRCRAQANGSIKINEEIAFIPLRYCPGAIATILA
jgi:hypothetical protein